MNQDQVNQVCWTICFAAALIIVAIKGIHPDFWLWVWAIVAILLAGFIIAGLFKLSCRFANYAVKQVTVVIPSLVTERWFQALSAIFASGIIWCIVSPETMFIHALTGLVGFVWVTGLLSPEINEDKI